MADCRLKLGSFKDLLVVRSYAQYMPCTKMLNHLNLSPASPLPMLSISCDPLEPSSILDVIRMHFASLISINKSKAAECAPIPVSLRLPSHIYKWHKSL